MKKSDDAKITPKNIASLSSLSGGRGGGDGVNRRPMLQCNICGDMIPSNVHLGFRHLQMYHNYQRNEIKTEEEVGNQNVSNGLKRSSRKTYNRQQKKQKMMVGVQEGQDDDNDDRQGVEIELKIKQEVDVDNIQQIKEELGLDVTKNKKGLVKVNDKTKFTGVYMNVMTSNGPVKLPYGGVGRTISMSSLRCAVCRVWFGHVTKCRKHLYYHRPVGSRIRKRMGRYMSSIAWTKRVLVFNCEGSGLGCKRSFKSKAYMTNHYLVNHCDWVKRIKKMAMRRWRAAVKSETLFKSRWHVPRLPKNVIKCPHCPRGFVELEGFKKHFRMCRDTLKKGKGNLNVGKVRVDSLISTFLKRFPCPRKECSRSKEGFPTALHLKCHMRKDHRAKKIESFAKEHAACLLNFKSRFEPIKMNVLMANGPVILPYLGQVGMIPCSTLRCIVCRAWFGNMTKLKAHLSTHRTAKLKNQQNVFYKHQKLLPYSCSAPGCARYFRFKAYQIHHQLINHSPVVERIKRGGMRRWAAGAQYKTKFKARWHLPRNPEKKMLNCPHCPRRFGKFLGYKNHFRTCSIQNLHKGNRSKKNRVAALFSVFLKRYQCSHPQCSQNQKGGFPSSLHLRCHVRKEHKVKPVRGGRRRQPLTTQSSTALDSNKVICHLCPQAKVGKKPLLYETKERLDDHIFRSHTNFKCPHCPEALILSHADLQKHLRLFHSKVSNASPTTTSTMSKGIINNASLVCPYSRCKMTFVSQRAYNAHVASHTSVVETNDVEQSVKKEKINGPGPYKNKTNAASGADYSSRSQSHDWKWEPIPIPLNEYEEQEQEQEYHPYYGFYNEQIIFKAEKHEDHDYHLDEEIEAKLEELECNDHEIVPESFVPIQPSYDQIWNEIDEELPSKDPLAMDEDSSFHQVSSISSQCNPQIVYNLANVSNPVSNRTLLVEDKHDRTGDENVQTCTIITGAAGFPSRSTEQYQYICKECGRCFTMIGRFRRHLQTHNKTLVCKEKGCNSKFFSMKKLEAHVQKVHKSKPYSCPSCSKSYGRIELLKIHQEFHHL